MASAPGVGPGYAARLGSVLHHGLSGAVLGVVEPVELLAAAQRGLYGFRSVPGDEAARDE